MADSGGELTGRHPELLISQRLGLRQARGDSGRWLRRSDQPGILNPMDYQRFITVEPGKRFGKPCIRGLRIAVQDVLEYLASGMTEAQILADFPDLTAEDIRACLAYAADRERKMVSVPAA